jgi:hypothetical protein
MPHSSVRGRDSSDFSRGVLDVPINELMKLSPDSGREVFDNYCVCRLQSGGDFFFYQRFHFVFDLIFKGAAEK